MPIELKNYPSLIAIPYAETLKKDSIQRKDFQRIVLENVLSLNAIVSIANYYQNNKPSDDPDAKKTKKKLSELKNFDLGQISVGTWNMFSRETQRVFGENPQALFLKNIYEMYHGAAAKPWEQVAGELISIRNKDAHGELIPADKLTAELDKRQIIIDKLLEQLDFYKDYQLIVPYQSDVVGGKAQFSCKNFYGASPYTVQISNFKDDIELFTLYLYNPKTGTALDLSPMLIVQPTDATGQEFNLFIYSKTTNKQKGNLHYLSLTSALEIESDKTESIGQFWTPAEITQEFAKFRIYVEDKSLHDQKKPAISIERTFKNDLISKEELAEIKIKIKNEGEASADNIKVLFKYPEDNFTWVNKEGEEFGKKDKIEDIFGEDFSIEPNQIWETALYYKAKEGGQYEFPVMSLTYEYTDFQGNEVKPKKDSEGNITNTEVSSSLFCTVFDPSDPYSLAPVINVLISADYGMDEEGKQKITPFIGDSFGLNVNVINTGLGIAKDVDLVVYPPESMQVKGGSLRWKGNINPLQTVSKKIEVECFEPGIHTISVRDIEYSNNDGYFFRTQGGIYNLLIRNNPKVQYQRTMERIWADLKLEEDEVEELNVMNKKFSKLLDIADMEEIEFEVKLKVIKSVVQQISTQKGFKLIEKAIGDKIVYMYKDILCPFLIVDFADRKNLKILIKGDLRSQYPIALINIRKYAKNKHFNLIEFQKHNNHKYQDFPGGIGNLKGLLGRITSWLESHDYLLVVAKDEITKVLGIHAEKIISFSHGNRIYSEFLTDDIENGKPDDDKEEEMDDAGNIWELNKDFFYRIYLYFDEKDQLVLCAQIKEIKNLYKDKLMKIGYKAMKRENETLVPCFTESTKKQRIFKVFGSKIRPNDDFAQYTKELQRFIIKVIELHNEEFLKNLNNFGVAEEVQKQILEVHNTFLTSYKEVEKQEGLLGAFFEPEVDEKKGLTMTYYAVKDFPLYQDKQKIFEVWGQKKKFEMAFRNCIQMNLTDFKEKIKPQKNYFPYCLQSLNDFDCVKELIIENICKSNIVELELNNYYFEDLLSNDSLGGFNIFLEILSENIDAINKDELQELLIDRGSGAKVSKISSHSAAFFNKFKFELPFDFDRKDRKFSLKTKFNEIINYAVNNYSLQYDDKTEYFHILKLILKSINENRTEYYGLNKKSMPVFLLRANSYQEIGKKTGLGGIEIGLKKNHIMIYLCLDNRSKSSYEMIKPKIDEFLLRDKMLLDDYNLNRNFDYEKANKNIYAKPFLESFVNFENITNFIDYSWVINIVHVMNEYIKSFYEGETLDNMLLKEVDSNEFDTIVNEIKSTFSSNENVSEIQIEPVKDDNINDESNSQTIEATLPLEKMEEQLNRGESETD